MQESSDDLISADRELERAFRSLPPIKSHVDPIVAAFRAGRASRSRQVHLWRCAAGIALTIGIGSRWILSHDNRINNINSNPSSLVVDFAPPLLARPMPAESVSVLNRAVLEHGLAGLPAQHVPAMRSLNLKNTL